MHDRLCWHWASTWLSFDKAGCGPSPKQPRPPPGCCKDGDCKDNRCQKSKCPFRWSAEPSSHRRPAKYRSILQPVYTASVLEVRYEYQEPGVSSHKGYTAHWQPSVQHWADSWLRLLLLVVGCSLSLNESPSTRCTAPELTSALWDRPSRRHKPGAWQSVLSQLWTRLEDASPTCWSSLSPEKCQTYGSRAGTCARLRDGGRA